ncbi:hypothetical protein R2601_04588 [Salipiger bermudensis HTCC2601]|uniref:Uncharacterized protein n=1 Tax=Salipiger bermudensis (strain DSM 26914 / JCM 13377 / KCTC 12554 / HTCC2601) TaxID=314265 RepID=Q0FVS8_SALBH|nr:hypothetical protein R2601_04588 [Salipiger bermudensis HTCC2601]
MSKSLSSTPAAGTLSTVSKPVE